MSFGNSSKPMVELGQIQHGEETQYQLRPAQEGCVPTLDNQSNMHHKTRNKLIAIQT